MDEPRSEGNEKVSTLNEVCATAATTYYEFLTVFSMADLGSKPEELLLAFVLDTTIQALRHDAAALPALLRGHPADSPHPSASPPRRGSAPRRCAPRRCDGIPTDNGARR